MVHLQKRLIDHLTIQTLHAVVGGSLGGHQTLVWAERYPERVKNAVLLAASPRLTSQALAFDVIGRNAILRDPNFHGGQYYEKSTRPEVGLALARMLGHITYVSREAMTSKFDSTRLSPRDVTTEFEKIFSVGSYLAHQGHKFVERFDANSYITLTRAMDLFDLGDSPQKLADRFAAMACRWLVISFTSDWLFPPEQSRQIVDGLMLAGKRVSYSNIASPCGHDAFLLDNDLGSYGSLIEGFLAQESEAPAEPLLTPSPNCGCTSIFHGNRLDHDLILELIDDGASVLDLGCGEGELLSLLRKHRNPSRLLGVELSEQAIRCAVHRGLDVVQMDLRQPLSSFTNQQFDVVVLSQTLQSVAETGQVIDEMLRVGRCGIVSFPNFAYHKLRRMLFEQGRSPKAPGPFNYDWHNTPNCRFPSILDFQDFCRQHDICVEKEIYLDSERDLRITHDPNLNADVAIFVISRRRRSKVQKSTAVWPIAPIE
jgi:homoserine O-acetyltransferase